MAADKSKEYDLNIVMSTYRSGWPMTITHFGFALMQCANTPPGTGEIDGDQCSSLKPVAH